MKSKQAVEVLRTAAEQALTALRANHQAAVVTILTAALGETVPRQQQTAQQKAEARATKRFGKRQERLIKWLKSDGITAGAQIVRLSDGVTVTALTEPRIGVGGPVIDIRYKDGKQEAVDPLAFRPDFSIIAKAAVAKASTPTTAVKPATTPSTKPQAARKSA